VSSLIRVQIPNLRSFASSRAAAEISPNLDLCHRPETPLDETNTITVSRFPVAFEGLRLLDAQPSQRGRLLTNRRPIGKAKTARGSRAISDAQRSKVNSKNQVVEFGCGL
jgi:hypothetical protein